MKELTALKNWKGSEGFVKRGDSFTASTNEREKELIKSGRAIFLNENKSLEVKETKGGSTPDKIENKDFEIKEKKAPVKRAKAKPKTEDNKGK